MWHHVVPLRCFPLRHRGRESRQQRVTRFSMPAASPFNATIPPYSFIRVDNFHNNLPRDTRVALHLLTHAHADHILGLEAKAFASRVLCSADTKQLLLNNEKYRDRELLDKGQKVQRTKPYSHLQFHTPPMSNNHALSRDLLVLHLPPLLT